MKKEDYLSSFDLIFDRCERLEEQVHVLELENKAMRSRESHYDQNLARIQKDLDAALAEVSRLKEKLDL